MYAVTSKPLISLTRATLRRAEFGFLGVVVYTRVHTPRRCGHPFSAGVLLLLTFALRPLRTSCWIVGTGSASLFGLAAAPSFVSLVCRYEPEPGVLTRLARDTRAYRPGCVADPRGRACRPHADPGKVAHRGGGRAPSHRFAHRRGRTHNSPGNAGHEGKAYRPCAPRSKPGPRS